MSDRIAPRPLWLAAQRFLHELYNLFGALEDVARQHTLTKKPYALMLDWLRAGEAFLRRLLLIEAAALNLEPIAPRRSARKPRQRKLVSFDADKPEAWRVSFRCSISPTLRQAQADAQFDAKAQNSVGLSLSKTSPRSAQSHRFHSAWPLAERYEALIRVFNDPLPYARRLARRLRATPQRTAAILRHPENAPDLFGRESFAQTETPCAEAAKRIDPG